MQNRYVDIESISDLQRVLYGCGKPKHPLITLVDLAAADRIALQWRLTITFYRLGFYSITAKNIRVT